jgi:hypothetical protein
MNAPATGIIDIRGKSYQTVALRVQMFRERHPDHALTTAVIARTEDCVVMRADISDPAGRLIATGHAEEYRKSSQINKTSALENAETSAIGRALAAFGIGGTEFASANEVQNAIHQQGRDEGHSQQGAVSPQPPEQPRNWGGMYPTKTALKKAMHVHHAELERLGIEGCMDDLDEYLSSPEYSAFVAIASEHAPYYLEGQRHPDAPPEFIQTFTLEAKARDMIALRGNVPA